MIGTRPRRTPTLGGRIAHCVAIPSLLAAACSTQVPVPIYTSQPTTALLPLPYSPPPARVERLPEKPRGGAVWIDGEWIWQTNRWAWIRGRWVTPPIGAVYAPWTATRSTNGFVYYASGGWRDAKGHEIPPPAPLATAIAVPGTVLDADGIAIESRRILAPPGSPPKP